MHLFPTKTKETPKMPWTHSRAMIYLAHDSTWSGQKPAVDTNPQGVLLHAGVLRRAVIVGVAAPDAIEAAVPTGKEGAEVVNEKDLQGVLGKAALRETAKIYENVAETGTVTEESEVERGVQRSTKEAPRAGMGDTIAKTVHQYKKVPNERIAPNEKPVPSE